MENNTKANPVADDPKIYKVIYFYSTVSGLIFRKIVKDKANLKIKIKLCMFFPAASNIKKMELAFEGGKDMSLSICFISQKK